MEPKVYRLAFMAVICVAIVSFKSYAYQNPAPAPAPLPQPAPVAPIINLAPLASLVTPVINSAVARYMASDNKNDKKNAKQLQRQMQKLEEKLSNLQIDKIVNVEALTSYYEKRADEFARNFSDDPGQQIAPELEHQSIDLDRQVENGEMSLKSKTYSKTYPVDNNDKLQIDNCYGNVTVKTWSKNEFKVDVEIKSYANAAADAQKMLDQVRIIDNQNNSVVSFTTIIGGNSGKSFWSVLNSNGKTTVRKTMINYTVYMPAKNPLTITNSYGAVVLPDLSGKVTIKSTYSNLISKALTNADNTINIMYGNADMESLVGSKLRVAYGNLNLEWADNLTANVSYSGAKIGKISNSATINLEYGDGLQIGSLDKNLKNLSVNSSYATIKIGKMSNNNTNFNITQHYGDFNFDDGINITSKSTADKSDPQATQNYKGRIGKGSNNSWIVIKSDYSDIQFDQ